MSIYKNGKLIAGGRQTIPLLSFMWADHILNDISWLRADTFSWQSGAVYTAVYQHLVDDIDGITAESETVGGITISFYRAPDGHKITTDESAVLGIYNATGVAWYYVLDTVNTRFKLPRTKFGFTGIRSEVGGYVDAGLPDITAKFISTNTWGGGLNLSGAAELDGSYSNGGFGGGNGRANSNGTVAIKASNSSTIYGNSDTVQPKATQMYLYFYVGQFTQTALENTAGINAETLNGKVDKGHQVVDYQEPTSANNYTWYRKYADGWVEQGGVYDRGSVATSWNTTITLPVIMQNTNYTAIVSAQWMDGDHLGENGINVEEKTTSSLKIYFYTDASGDGVRAACWEVKGIAA